MTRFSAVLIWWFVLLLVGWTQAEHDGHPRCRAQYQAAEKAYTLQPTIKSTMSEDEQARIITTWKAQRAEAIAKADAALKACMKDNP